MDVSGLETWNGIIIEVDIIDVRMLTASINSKCLLGITFLILLNNPIKQVLLSLLYR